MPILTKLADMAASLFCRITGLSRASRWSVHVANHVASTTVTVSDEMDYVFAASSPLALWRARTLFDKEPETIAWIRSFSPDDVFFDVGANVGVFSIYAGRRGARVFAFEPEAGNYALLNRNIASNQLSGKVRAFPVALSDVAGFDTLRLSSLAAGAALHTYGTDVGFNGERMPSVFEQGCLAMTLDELVYTHGFPHPTHIKIDVDGLEGKVIQGAQKVLRDERLRDLLIEINDDDAADVAMIQSLEALGLRIAVRGETVMDGSGRYRLRNVVLSRLV